MQHKIVRKIVTKDCENMNLGRGCMRKIVINHVQTICRLQVNMERQDTFFLNTEETGLKK